MKNDIPRQIYISKDLDKFIKEEAEKNSRSSASQIRHWINLIKSGKIKIDEVG